MPTRLNPRLVPALLVKDMPATLAFYAQLGFELTRCHPDHANATWAEVARDGVALQFHSEPPSGTPPEPICSGTFYFFPESVEALASEWRDRVRFEWGPEEMEYGMREFGLQDPNGYYLAFTEPADGGD
jgi:catechol 2,3-dioxygenase-like lactoylglutathione lyase family enzyme